MSDQLLVQLALAIFALPLLSYLALIFIGKRLPRGGDWLGTSLVFLGLAFALTIACTKLGTPGTIDASFHWIDLGTVPMLGDDGRPRNHYRQLHRSDACSRYAH